MSKARRKAKGRKPEKAPAVHKFPGKGKAKPEPKARDESPPAIHKFAGKRAEAAKESAKESRESAKESAKEPAKAKSPPPAAKGMAARLAAMAAASAELNDEPDVEVKAKPGGAPKGGVEWKDFDDDEDGEKAPPEPKPGTPGGKANGAHRVEPDEPVLVAPKAVAAQEVDPGVQVVGKAASKFSAADLEALRAAIKVKGTGNVVEGINLDELKWDNEGLLPIVAQDRRTGAVLMVGHTSKETLEATLRTKQVSYFDRHTGKAQVRDENSGHAQRLVRLAVDCDKDAIWAVVDSEGPACNKGGGTCWTTEHRAPVAGFLGELDRIIQDRARTPQKGSHTNELLAEPLQALRRFVEEANEVTRNIQGKSTQESLEHAVSDLLYHLLVVLRTKGIGMHDVLTELQARHLAMELQKAKQ